MIEPALSIACPLCDSPPGVSCVAMQHDAERRGTVKPTPHGERVRDSWRQAHALAMDAAIIEAIDYELEVARRGFWPPRWRSETESFVPPSRTLDPDAPAVVHPYYPPVRRRRRSRMAGRAQPFVHPEWWVVVRDGGAMVAVSRGLWRGAGGETP